MEQPKVFREEEYAALSGTWQPKYALTAGITNHMILKCVRQALEKTNKTDYLTEALRRQYRLIGLSEALEKIHFPKDEKEVCEARRRLVFDEIFSVSSADQTTEGNQRPAGGRASAQPGKRNRAADLRASL